ncbi:MAG: helix-turn-helix domain-containing protein, partial [Rhodococcus sp. (in: high G+C Gram-positive bacteria)]
RQLFARRWSARVTLVVRGTDDSAFAASTLAGLDISERRRLRVGIGAPHPVSHLAQSVRESRLAASSAAAGADPVEFGSLVGGVLLAHASTREALTTVGDATIAPLEKYDAANGTDLVASLRAFLEANGHWESAASALGVHRHTLRSRVSRIEETVPCSLDNARVRAELLLALIARGT